MCFELADRNPIQKSIAYQVWSIVYMVMEPSIMNQESKFCFELADRNSTESHYLSSGQRSLYGNETK